MIYIWPAPSLLFQITNKQWPYGSDLANPTIEIFVVTDRENNEFLKKLIMDNHLKFA